MKIETRVIILCAVILGYIPLNAQYTRIDSFRIDIGTNLNLIDEISPAGLYANIRTFVPGLISFKKGGGRPVNPKWGLHAGIYANRIFSDSTMDNSNIINTVERLNGSDTSSLLSTTYVSTESRTIENFGLYFNPILQITKAENAAVFFGINVEAARRREKDSRDFIKTNTELLPANVSRPDKVSVLPNASETKIIYEGFIGVSFPFVYELGSTKFTFIPGFGHAISPLINWYTDFRFDVIENKSGISIGGDIRGIVPNSSSPRLNVYVSKAFTFGDLTKYKR